MVAVYIFSLFLSSSLLFFVQPMVGKMLLPILGGSPAVWNTCMVFFQAILLAGYAYAHISTRLLGARRQAFLHIGLMLIPLLVLPIAISPALLDSVPVEQNPTYWLLGALFFSAGLPFFVVSTTAPLLQMWFSTTNHQSAHDPYFLYSASNAGSMSGLLAYPFLLEPLAPLREQSVFWHIAYLALILCIAGCALFLYRSKSSGREPRGPDRVEPVTDRGSRTLAFKPVTLQRRLFWILLAFIPSSLMIGVTTYITTDIASAPLLWVIPLALYLLSFILVFARRPIFLPSWCGRAFCLVATVLIVVFFAGMLEKGEVLFLGIHLLMFFIAAMICHGRLAKDRPPTQFLTEYFLWISVGGVLGGIFNALIAPLLFTVVLEYVLVLALVCGVREVGESVLTRKDAKNDILYPAIVGCVAVVLVFLDSLIRGDVNSVSLLVLLGLPAVAMYSFVERPSRFAIALVILIGVGVFHNALNHQSIFHERNFFGTIRVVDDIDKRTRRLLDGNTVHGMENLDTDKCSPLAYYHPNGPMGLLFDVYHRDWPTQAPKTSRVALVGLGIGSLTCYAKKEERWDLYEINPAVAYVARDPKYFTALSRSQAGNLELILGDARLKLQDTESEIYDIIIVDAFSSDSIPIHLITREAIELYQSKLAPEGLIAIHISNRILRLEPVLSSIGTLLNMATYGITDSVAAEAHDRDERQASHWVFMARDMSHLRDITEDSRVKPMESFHQRYAWTDSYSNITSVLK